MPELGYLIQRCRENFGSPPRTLTREEEEQFLLRPSFLMRLAFWVAGDRLRIVVRDQHLLRECGQVVWGCLVQANQLLFDGTNRQALPANVIYSPDNYFDEKAALIRETAGGLFELKGTSPGDLELEEFAKAITDERARTMRLRLPQSLSQGKEIYFTTCIIQPSHLPESRLALGYFPLLICPEKTEAVMILPSRYWPEELCKLWISGEDKVIAL
jgi:hypothetical protein